MPSHKRLVILTLAAASALAGCDRGSSPQGQISDKIAEGRIAAAQGDDAGRSKAKTLLNQAIGISDAPDASLAQAKAALGEVQLQAAAENLKIVNQNDLTASQIALQMAALGAQLGSSATMVQGYNKLEPKEAKLAIEQKIVQAKGDSKDSKWIGDNGVSLPSLAAATAKIADLQSQIDKKQGDVKALDTKRQAALADAETSMKASESAKGQAAVDAYTKASNARKQASDFQTQMDVINGAITPLQKDLAIAQGQQQILQTVITELTDESKSLDEGWQGVQNKIQAQLDLMKQIASAPSAAPAPSTQQADSEQPAMINSAGGSIAVKATALAQAVTAADKAREEATQNLTDAIKDFKDAQVAASSAVSKLELAEVDQPNLKAVYDQAIATLDPQSYRFRQAGAQRVLAGMQISQAGGLDARIKLRDMLVPMMSAAQLTPPKEVSDPNLEKQFKDATTEAAQNLDDADQQLVNVIEGPAGRGASEGISTSLKASAAVARIFVLYSQEQLARITGNAKLVAQKEASARAAVTSAVELQASFPSLPGDLAMMIPAPAAPATAPTTAPAQGATTNPSADAGSPDEQAIHTAMSNFVAATAKGDTAAAQQFVQIEPGQEEFFNQMVALFGASQKFSEAMQSKFGTAAGGSPGVANFAQALQGMHVTIKGDEGFASPAPGMPEKKQFVRVDGQWKLYIGPPDAMEKLQRQMIPKLTAGLSNLADGITAGKYATAQDVIQALPTAMAGAAGNAATPAAPAADQANTTPAPAPAPTTPGRPQ